MAQHRYPCAGAERCATRRHGRARGETAPGSDRASTILILEAHTVLEEDDGNSFVVFEAAAGSINLGVVFVLLASRVARNMQ